MKHYRYIWIILVAIAFAACKKDEPAPIASVEIDDVIIETSYREAEISWSVVSNATVSEVVAEYALDSTFSKYEQAKMSLVNPKSDDHLYSVSLKSLAEGTQYFLRCRALNKINSHTSAPRAFKTIAYHKPEVETDSITDITVSSALLHATLLDWGTDSLPEVGFCVATHADVSIADSCLVYSLETDQDSVTFAMSLNNLIDNTTYYVRAYAKNNKGVTYGEELYFTTYEIGLPQVGSTSITEVSYITATITSEVLSDGGSSIIERGICYSTSHNPTISNSKVQSEGGIGSFTCILTDLTDGTTYYACAYATNSKGMLYGKEISFTTKQYGLPIVTTSDVSNISFTSATCGGNVTDDGGQAVTERGICFSTSQNPTVANNKVVSGSGTGSFTYNLTGLTEGTKYYARAYATNSKGTSYGSEMTFTTTSYTLPTVTTSSVTNITNTSATCGGNVTDDGGQAVIERGICYSTSPSPTLSDMVITCGNGLGIYTCDIMGLTIGPTYYARAYATNSKGTSYGNEVSFSTIEVTVPKVIVQIPPTAVSANSLICYGIIKSDGNSPITEYGFCWSYSPNPTINNNKLEVTAISEQGAFSGILTNVENNKYYYVLAYAKNAKGISYSSNNNDYSRGYISVVTYEASQKLTETTGGWQASGFHVNASGAIASHEFANGTGTIVFKSKCTEIGSYTFQNCTELSSIIIPNSVETIKQYAFNGCSNLCAITLSENITSIGSGAFSDCTGLTSVILPNGLASIGSYIFENCASLTSVTIPNSVTSIGGYAFRGCTSLTSITIPNSITSIGDGTFSGCTGLTSMTIPNSVTSIGDDAFRGCTSLTSITIPNSITSIGDDAFYGCTGLTSITCRAVTPPTCGSNVFWNVSKSIPLYVPSSSISAYRQAVEWKKFTNILPLNE